MPVDGGVVAVVVAPATDDEDGGVAVRVASVAWKRIWTPGALNPSGPTVVEVAAPSPGRLVVNTKVAGASPSPPKVHSSVEYHG